MPYEDKPLIQSLYRKHNGKVHRLSIGDTLRPFDDARRKELLVALTYRIHAQNKKKQEDQDNT